MDDWFRELSEEAQFVLIDRLKDAEKTHEMTDWLCFKRYMHGKLKKYRIWELYFAGDKRQYRILGVTGSERKQAIFLVGCYHKDGVYAPPGALKMAYKGAKDLAEKKATIYERKIPTNR
jgi:hypothetical protein